MTTRRRSADVARLAEAYRLCLELLATDDSPVADLAEALACKIDNLTAAGWPEGWHNSLADLARRMLPTRPVAAPTPAPPARPVKEPPAARRKTSTPLFSGPPRDKRPFQTR